MKKIYFLLLMIAPFLGHAQAEGTEIEWSALRVDTFETVKSAETQIEFSRPVFSDDLVKMNGQTIIIKGNYHVLNSFGSKTFLLSKDEIIMNPMHRDEVVRLMMVEDPNIYFGRKVKIMGTLHIDEDPEAETLYYITDVKKIDNTGKVVEGQ